MYYACANHTHELKATEKCFEKVQETFNPFIAKSIIN